MSVLFVAAAISWHGWIDGYYATNSNHPDSRLNFFDGVGTSAHRSGQPALNVAAVDVSHEAKPFGFHVTAVAGDSADVVHAGEPDSHRRAVRYVYQASLAYNAPLGRGLLLEAGVYPSHIGFEGFFTKDNWNYSRGWLGELSPYYQSGIKASYAFNDQWSAQFHVVRGWQLIGDNNSSLSYGTQIAYSGARWSASLNTFVGPELPADDTHLRRFVDVVATWKATQRLTLGASIDRGRQEYAGRPPANWVGVAAYTRWVIDERHAVAARAERFRDPDAGISGTAQRLGEGTLTYEYRPSDHWIVKLEARRDHSTAPVFAESNDQTLAIASAVLQF